MDYEILLRGFHRAPHLRLSVTFASGRSRLLILPPRATLNDVYKWVDSPGECVALNSSEGDPMYRTDQFVRHWLENNGLEPWSRRPDVYGLVAITTPHSILVDPPPLPLRGRRRRRPRPPSPPRRSRLEPAPSDEAWSDAYDDDVASEASTGLHAQA